VFTIRRNQRSPSSGIAVQNGSEYAHQDAIGGLALAAVAGHGISIVEMVVDTVTQPDGPAIVEPHLYLTVGVDRLNGAEFTVGDVPPMGQVR
jgi:hypothetical protein